MNVDDLRLSDLKEEYRLVAETIGLKNYIELCRVFGGAPMHIPNHYSLYKNYYKRMILADNRKHSDKELAKMYNISPSTIYNIRKDAAASAANAAPGGFSIQDLSPHLRDIAEVIGFGPFLALCDVYAASVLYIPTEKELTKRYIECKILKSKDFFSKKELARIYNVSLSTVYKILGKQEQ